jgi:hypothetical protein
MLEESIEKSIRENKKVQRISLIDMPKKYKFYLYSKRGKGKKKIATLTTRKPYLKIGKKKFKYKSIY